MDWCDFAKRAWAKSIQALRRVRAIEPGLPDYARVPQGNGAPLSITAHFHERDPQMAATMTPSLTQTHRARMPAAPAIVVSEDGDVSVSRVQGDDVAFKQVILNEGWHNGEGRDRPAQSRSRRLEPTAPQCPGNVARQPLLMLRLLETVELQS